LSGPADDLPHDGAITVAGLGTGLGVSLVVRRDGHSTIVESEGGHIGFAPRTEGERRIEERIVGQHGRCSVERVASGPGLADIHAVLGGDPMDAAALWDAALDGTDARATEALDILIGAFGAAVGDLSLAHGSTALVIT